MPRDSAGNYTLPAGNPVVTGTTIESVWANTTMDDLRSEVTNSLDRAGRGGMTGPLRIADGTEAAPGVGFALETGTGWYRAGAGDVGASVLGTRVLTLDASGLTVTGALTATGTLNAAVAVVTGDVGGATGTFTGKVSGGDGSFSGNVTAVGGSFSGALDGATVSDASGQVYSPGNPPPVTLSAVVGQLMDVAFEPDGAWYTANPGWLKCGQAVSRTTYSALFTLLGTTWGVGDGSTTFDLPPNARMTVATGADGGTTFAIGDEGGAETVTLDETQIPSHTHSYVKTPNAAGTSSGGQPSSGNEAADTTGATGGGLAHENMPPYMAVARLIYAGV